MNVGINGFGRIGKNVFKVLIARDIKIGLINDPMVDLDYIIYTLKYDTVYTTQKIAAEKVGNGIKIGEMVITVTHEKTPALIDWESYGVNCVVEASGVFNNKQDASAHNAKIVICTGPASDIPMFVYGVNHREITFDTDTLVISAASCTTNCVAPILKLVDEKYKIKEGTFNTIHAVTVSQGPVDKYKKDFRLGRSCFNIIPSTTGAAHAIEKVLPGLIGKLKGMATRVPIVDVSLADITLSLTEKMESINDLEKLVLDNEEFFKDVVCCTNEQVVSSDFVGSSHSCIVDLSASFLVNSHFVKIVCWYDNEHAYSCRVVDLFEYITSIKN